MHTIKWPVMNALLSDDYFKIFWVPIATVLLFNELVVKMSPTTEIYFTCEILSNKKVAQGYNWRILFAIHLPKLVSPVEMFNSPMKWSICHFSHFLLNDLFFFIPSDWNRFNFFCRMLDALFDNNFRKSRSVFIPCYAPCSKLR